MATTALVLGGGGSRGAYEVGVWRALRERGTAFSIVTGTSVGALNGAIVAQGDYDLAVDIWSRITTEMILDLDEAPGDRTLAERLQRLGVFAREIVAGGGADSAPLRRLLYEVLDEEKIRRSPLRFGLVTVQLPTMTPKALFADEIERGTLIDYVMASAACFPAMRKQVIGQESYIDGGYFDNLPVELAVRGGADRAVAVDIHGVGLRRRADARTPVHTVTTGWNLGSILLFDAETAQRNMELGYLDALKSWGDLDGRLFAFEKGEGALLRPGTERLREAWDALFPHSPRGVHELLRLRMMRYLGGLYRAYGAEQPKGEDALHLAAAENAGKVLGLSPTRRWTANEYEAAVREAYLSAQPPDPAALEAILAQRSDGPAKTAERLVSEVERLSPARIARGIGDLQAAPAPSAAGMAKLAALAAAFPGEFLCALYAAERPPATRD